MGTERTAEVGELTAADLEWADQSLIGSVSPGTNPELYSRQLRFRAVAVLLREREERIAQLAKALEEGEVLETDLSGLQTLQARLVTRRSHSGFDLSALLFRLSAGSRASIPSQMCVDRLIDLLQATRPFLPTDAP